MLNQHRLLPSLRVSAFVFVMGAALMNTACGRGESVQAIAAPEVPAAPGAPTQYGEEDPMIKARSIGGYETAILISLGGNATEIGMGFVPQFNGRITGIALRMPYVENNLHVTLWDKSTAKPIWVELVAVSEINRRMIAPIFPIEVKKDVEYRVSVTTSQSIYGAVRASGPAVLPLSLDNLSVTGFYSSFVSTSGVVSMPTLPNPSVAYLSASVVFQRTPTAP